MLTGLVDNVLSVQEAHRVRRQHGDDGVWVEACEAFKMLGHVMKEEDHNRRFQNINIPLQSAIHAHGI